MGIGFGGSGAGGRFGRYAVSPMYVGLKMAMRIRGGEGGLKILLGHGVCPFNHARCHEDIVKTLWEVDFEEDVVNYLSVLERVFFDCELRCRCEKCETNGRRSIVELRTCKDVASDGTRFQGASAGSSFCL